MEASDTGNSVGERFDVPWVAAEGAAAESVVLHRGAGGEGASPYLGPSQRKPFTLVASPLPLETPWSRRHPATGNRYLPSHAMARLGSRGCGKMAAGAHQIKSCRTACAEKSVHKQAWPPILVSSQSSVSHESNRAILRRHIPVPGFHKIV